MKDKRINYSIRNRIKESIVGFNTVGRYFGFHGGFRNYLVHHPLDKYQSIKVTKALSDAVKQRRLKFIKKRQRYFEIKNKKHALIKGKTHYHVVHLKPWCDQEIS